MVTILIVLAVLMLIGAIPAWPHSQGVGVWPQRRSGPDLGDCADLAPHRSNLGEESGRGSLLIQSAGPRGTAASSWPQPRQSARR